MLNHVFRVPLPTNEHPDYLDCPVSEGEAGSGEPWGDSGLGRLRSMGSQPARAPGDASAGADNTALRVRESCSSSGRVHLETGSQPEETETRCSWRCREKSQSGMMFCRYCVTVSCHCAVVGAHLLAFTWMLFLALTTCLTILLINWQPPMWWHHYPVAVGPSTIFDF